MKTSEIAELKKYYKKVLICINRTCNRPYGIDLKRMGNGLCPICSNKMSERHSKLERRYLNGN